MKDKELIQFVFSKILEHTEKEDDGSYTTTESLLFSFDEETKGKMDALSK